jgi:hypothetical protein
VQAIKDATPSIMSLQQQLDAAGLKGGAMFQKLVTQAKLASDAIAGPALTAIEGYTAGMVGLSNAGQLSTTDFAALAGQIGATEQALEAQGVARADVLPAMQTDLQSIWELQQQNHQALDDYTQGLVDQAVQEGLVGETHKSTTDQMLDLTQRMTAAVEALAHVFGVDLPSDMATFEKTGTDAAGNVAAAVAKIPTNVDVNVTTHNTTDPDAPPRPDAGANPDGYANGGVVRARYLANGGEIWPWSPMGTDTQPAMLTPGERVLSVSQNQAFESGQLGGTTVHLTVQIDRPVVNDKRMLDAMVDQVYKKLPAKFLQTGRY